MVNILCIIGGIGALVLVVTMVGCLWWARFNPCRIFTSKEKVYFGRVKSFSLRELQKATDNFNRNNVVGAGGTAHVFRGRLRDGTIVAVKRMRESTQFDKEIDERQLLTEIEIISLARHKNLITLTGFCITPAERILVYPFMPNGSVAFRLRGGDIVLEWMERKRIAKGTAEGLWYMHTQCDPAILHRDVKAANVFLDENCNAVVGDFGLAKLMRSHNQHHEYCNHTDLEDVQSEESMSRQSAVAGTLGYIAPEYFATGILSTKSDVYGFGVFLVELLTAKKPNDQSPCGGELLMLDWVRRVWREKKNESVDDVMDGRLENRYDREEAQKMLCLALNCCEQWDQLRPNMPQVLTHLRQIPAS